MALINPFNPYSQNRTASTVPEYVTDNGEPVMETLRAGIKKPRSGKTSFSNSTPLIASNGELNATSKRDLMKNMLTMRDMVQQGKIRRSSADITRQRLAAHKELLRQAFNERNSQVFEAIGQVISDEIYESMGREGFARNVLAFCPLEGDETARIKIRTKDVISYVVTANPEVVACHVRAHWLYPQEFYLICTLLAENKDIAQTGGTLIDDKYQDGMESIFVQEDLVWKTLADLAAPAQNNLYVFNTLTPSTFSALRTQVWRWGITPTTAIISFDLWDDIITDSEFANWWSEVAKHEIILTGKIGGLLDVELRTDGYRQENLQVLNPGEIYMCGAPESLGAICERQPVISKPIDQAVLQRPQRGWYLEAIEGMAIANSKAISRGYRV